ncbi:hypothetical protein GGQ92_003130 [Gracilibacillus halotolerans]|uniref:NAD(P)-binding domain-containing protein n=1 Tax=Gracilibacillus halotolerans TaxID=74386 RepID=A0A841RR57_9BACI|nr:NAD(P)H-binding protein [Gracilibacillus halotolerans]MBB6514307.1 hypothetical protein [Gracilibacillus halotolerans]
MKRVLVLGATGRTGNAIIRQIGNDEKIEVIAGIRGNIDVARLPKIDRPIKEAVVDIDSISSLSDAASSSDIIINAIRLRGNIPPNALMELDMRIRNAISNEKYRHIITVGGAGSLQVSNGRRYWEDKQFPKTTLPRGIAHANLRQHLERNMQEDSWTYLIPPPKYLPTGLRTGKYERWEPSINESHFLTKSISYEDFAVAVSSAIREEWEGTHLIGNREV